MGGGGGAGGGGGVCARVTFAPTPLSVLKVGWRKRNEWGDREESA